MSEFVYCLNTSTIRPTPLLEKIAGRRQGRLPGDRALERRDHGYLDEGGTLAELKRRWPTRG